MPAIAPVKLKLQVARLAETYTQPAVFIQELHTLLRLYADNTNRPGLSGNRQVLVKTYNTPLPVLRQVRVGLSTKTNSDPDGVLNLCDSLWRENYYEHRLLASMLVGELPVEVYKQTIQRIENWAQTTTDDLLSTSLLDYSLARLCRESPTIILEIAGKWIQSPEKNLQRLGIHTLIPLVSDPNFHNLPAVFRLLGPSLRNPTSSTSADVLLLLNQLIQVSPYETAHALQSILNATKDVKTAQLIRKTLSKFPREIQIDLRQALGSLSQRAKNDETT